MSVSLPTTLPKPKTKRDAFVPPDVSKTRQDFDKRIKELQVESKGWWKQLLQKKPEPAIGVGCGVGFGMGVTGAAGIEPIFSLHLPVQAVFGFGVGCGAGVGYGVGFGIGKLLKPYASNPKVKRI